MASGVAIEIATLGGYTLAFGFHEAAGLGLMTSGCATAMYHAQDMSLDMKTTFRAGTYPFDFSIDRMEKKKKSKSNAAPENDKQKQEPSKSNTDQNKQAKDARRKIARDLGKKLTQDEERKFHDHVTKQGYNYHELVEEGYWLFHEQ